MTEITDGILAEIEAKRHLQEDDKAGEAALSINAWIGRVQGAAKTAHSAARAGETSVEREAWIEAATICVARAELLDDVETGDLVYEKEIPGVPTNEELQARLEANPELLARLVDATAHPEQRVSRPIPPERPRPSGAT